MNDAVSHHHQATSDPITIFLEEQQQHGRSPRTITAYGRVVQQFEGFLEERSSTALDEATRRDCMAWVHSLRADLAPSTVATYASYLHRFYGYMVEIGEFDRNPMRLVMEELSESISTDPTRRDISLEDMRKFLSSINHPLQKAVIVVFLKTGIRVGELSNLDCRDVSIPELANLYDLPESRGELDGRENAIFVPTTPTIGREYNGEIRSASNKRQRETIIPIDSEVKSVLHRWFAVRPDPISPANPLFISTTDQWGSRLEPDEIRRFVRQRTEAMGWYRAGGSRTENVTPHYFRHFFTTHMRDRIGDRGIVKYLRGDVADDILDTYTHNWGDRVRKHYEANIYSLLNL